MGRNRNKYQKGDEEEFWFSHTNPDNRRLHERDLSRGIEGLKLRSTNSWIIG